MFVTFLVSGSSLKHVYYIFVNLNHLWRINRLAAALFCPHDFMFEVATRIRPRKMHSYSCRGAKAFVLFMLLLFVLLWIHRRFQVSPLFDSAADVFCLSSLVKCLETICFKRVSTCSPMVFFFRHWVMILTETSCLVDVVPSSATPLWINALNVAFPVFNVLSKLFWIYIPVPLRFLIRSPCSLPWSMSPSHVCFLFSFDESGNYGFNFP